MQPTDLKAQSWQIYAITFFFNSLKPETLSNDIVWGLKKQTKIIQFYHTLIHERRLYWLLITMRYERKKKISIHIFSDHLLLTMSHFSWKSGQLHSVLPKGVTGISVAKISYFNKSSCICLLVQTHLCWNRIVDKRQFSSTAVLE